MCVHVCMHVCIQMCFCEICVDNYAYTNDDEYTGGDLEFADFDDSTQRFTVPKSRGTVIVFDSRTPHRVSPIKSGVRKSLVGWVVGPRWK